MATVDDCLVEIREVAKRFGTTQVLKGIDLDVRRGEVTCMLGRSGSGKTTLLRCINRLETIDAGYIRVDGELVGFDQEGHRLRERPEREIARMRSHIGMVFQQFNLFAHMTAVANIIEAPMRIRGLSRDEATKEALRLLERVGLADKAKLYPRQLSGGQQQRVAIARALAMSPKLMLFDEPTSALDPELVGEVLQTMRGLAADGMTMIVVTHEIGFAREVADSIVFLEDGRVVARGTPSEVLDGDQSGRLSGFLAGLGTRGRASTVALEAP